MYKNLWKETHRDLVNAQARRYYAKHQQHLRIVNKQWKKLNPEFVIWQNMLSRCNNPNTHNYKNYGGRGIKVLYNSYIAFISDVGRRPNKRYSIDRINNEGNYERGNCQWATIQQQNTNRRPRVSQKKLVNNSRKLQKQNSINRLETLYAKTSDSARNSKMVCCKECEYWHHNGGNK